MTHPMLEAFATLPPFLAAHVRLTLAALGIGLAVSLPLGILASRHPRWERLVLGLASILQTIPGLALLALMVAALGALSVWWQGLGGEAIPAIGFVPALAALALYSVLPILRNTVTGLQGVDPALREAALGVGMTARERLWQVDLPLALPTLVAGLRTAAVWVVGTATLATPVGATSLGNPIFAGLQTRQLASVVAGSVAAAALALLVDRLIQNLERALVERSRTRLGWGLAALCLLASGPSLYDAVASPSSHDERRAVEIGAKAFTEQYLLAAALAREVDAEPGLRARVRPSLGSMVAYESLAAGSLDLYVDYTGTLWATVLERDTQDTNRDAVFESLRQILPERDGIHVLARLGFENTYALAMRRADAETLGVRRISDLPRHAGGLQIGGDYEFFERAEWTALAARYGLRFAAQRAMDPALMYEAVRGGEVGVIGAYSTDGRIDAYDLAVLEDDRRVIPPYDAVLVASDRLVQAAPGLVTRLRDLDGRIDAARMRALNARVDLGGESVDAVAGDVWPP